MLKSYTCKGQWKDGEVTPETLVAARCPEAAAREYTRAEAARDLPRADRRTLEVTVLPGGERFNVWCSVEVRADVTCPTCRHGTAGRAKGRVMHAENCEEVTRCTG